MDPDPGGPKTCGSEFATLIKTLKNMQKMDFFASEVTEDFLTDPYQNVTDPEHWIKEK
jgi:hypothetical protein